MKRVTRAVATLGTCAVLSVMPLSSFAHGNDVGAAVVGGILGGLIGSAIVAGPAYPAYAPAPVVVEPYAPAPVVVERYRPAPVVVESYGLPRVVYYGDGGRRWHDRGWHRRHWHDDD